MNIQIADKFVSVFLIIYIDFASNRVLFPNKPSVILAYSAVASNFIIGVGCSGNSAAHLEAFAAESISTPTEQTPITRICGHSLYVSIE
jgi:hypothetical protein